MVAMVNGVAPVMSHGATPRFGAEKPHVGCGDWHDRFWLVAGLLFRGPQRRCCQPAGLVDWWCDRLFAGAGVR